MFACTAWETEYDAFLVEWKKTKHFSPVTSESMKAQKLEKEESSFTFILTYSLKPRDGALNCKLINVSSYSGFNFPCMSLLSFNFLLWESSILFSVTNELAEDHRKVAQTRQFFT